MTMHVFILVLISWLPQHRWHVTNLHTGFVVVDKALTRAQLLLRE